MEIVSPLSEFPLTPSTPPPTPNSQYTPNFPKIDMAMVQKQLKLEQGSWAVPDQLVLKQKITQCSIRKEAHWDTARNCAKKAKLLTIPKLILSTILASTLTLLTQEEDNKVLEYFTTGTSIVVALLTTVGAFLDYNVEKTKHRSSSLNYSNLAAYIDRVLRLPADERQSFGETLAKVNEKYAEIRRDAPFIKPYIIKNYIKTFTKQENIVPSKNILGEAENENENFTKHLLSLDRKMANIQADFLSINEQTEINTVQIKSALDIILSHLIGPTSTGPRILAQNSYNQKMSSISPDDLENSGVTTAKIRSALEDSVLSDLIGPKSDDALSKQYASLSSLSIGLGNISETGVNN